MIDQNPTVTPRGLVVYLAAAGQPPRYDLSFAGFNGQ